MKQRSSWPELVVVLALAALVTWNLWPNSYFYIYQIRDLDRAASVAQGSWILYGPETNGGNNLPGPLYYAISGLALAVWKDYRAVWLVMAALASGAAALVWGFLRRSSGIVAASVTVFLFLSTATLQYVLRQFYNASFTLLPLTAGLLCFAVAFQESAADRTRSRNAWALGCFVTGLALQLHLSSGLLLLAVVVVQLLAPRLGLRRVSRAAFAAGAVALILPLLPYAVFALAERFGIALGAPRLESSGTGAAAASDLVSTTLRELSSWGEQGWSMKAGAMVFLRALFLLSPYAIVLAGLIGAARFLRPSETGGEGSEFGKALRRVSGVLALVSLIPAGYFILIPARSRYAVPFAIGAALFTGSFLTDSKWVRSQFARDLVPAFLAAVAALTLALTAVLIPEEEYRVFALWGVLPALLLGGLLCGILYWRERKLQAGTALAVFGMCVGAVASVTLGRHSVHTNEMFPYFEDHAAIARYVRGRTGWEYEEARKRLFYVRTFNQSNPRWIWDSVAKEVPRATAASEPGPDGFFVVMSDIPRVYWLISRAGFGRDLPAPERRFMTKLITSDLEPSLLQAIRERKLRLEKPVPLSRRIALIPYRVQDPQTVPPRFQNAGYPYERYPEWDLVSGGFHDSEQVRRLGDGRLLFRWNECPGRHAYCTVGALVTVKGPGIGIRLVGDPLSVPAINTIPEWTQALIQPYVEVQCGKEVHRRTLAEAIGYHVKDPDAENRVHTLSHAFLAPFEAEWQPCRSAPDRITIGWDHSLVTRSLEQIRLDGRKLSSNL